MQAVMSDQLRQILRDRQGRRELQEGLLKLEAAESVQISVGGCHYKIQWMMAASNAYSRQTDQ